MPTALPDFDGTIALRSSPLKRAGHMLMELLSLGKKKNEVSTFKKSKSLCIRSCARSQEQRAYKKTRDIFNSAGPIN